MEFDPTTPPVREKSAFEKYFDVEQYSMAMEGYANRLDALVLRKRALLLFDQLAKKEKDVFIPYLALSYFDRFFSREELRDEDLELAVICCLFLASKMRQSSFSVHLFLTTWPNLNINQDLILEMESRILNALEWRMRSVNALCFVEYFIEMIPDNLRPSPRIVKEIIIQSECAIDFTRYRPSVIAASAVLTASSHRFPGSFQECLASFLSCDHVNMGDLNQCQDMILKICGRNCTFRVTSQTGEVSRPGKEPVPPESSETVDEIVPRRPGKEPVQPESSETVDEIIPRRPGKEPVDESLEMDAELVTEWENLMKEVATQRQEISEKKEEEPESEKENPSVPRDKISINAAAAASCCEVSSAAVWRWPGKAAGRQEISGITEEEPESGNENLLNFELKWISAAAAESAARDYTRDISLTNAAASSCDVSSAVAACGGSNPEGTDRHSTGSDGGDDNTSLFKCCKLLKL